MRDPTFHGGTETDLLPTSVASGSGTFAFANFGNFCQLLWTFANCLPTSGNLCQLFANFYKLSATLVVLTYTGTGLELWATFAFENCMFFYPLMKSGANVQFFNFLRYIPICVLFAGLESLLQRNLWWVYDGFNELFLDFHV